MVRLVNIRYHYIQEESPPLTKSLFMHHKECWAGAYHLTILNFCRPILWIGVWLLLVYIMWYWTNHIFIIVTWSHLNNIIHTKECLMYSYLLKCKWAQSLLKVWFKQMQKSQNGEFTIYKLIYIHSYMYAYMVLRHLLYNLGLFNYHFVFVY